MSCQNTIQSCGLFTKLCDILMASGIPADILTETINTLSEVIRGNQKNQVGKQNQFKSSYKDTAACGGENGLLENANAALVFISPKLYTVFVLPGDFHKPIKL